MRHTIHARSTHTIWDRDLPPRLTVANGDELEVETRDASGGQLGPASGPAEVAAMAQDRVNPVTGPVYVDGAQPGDALVVRVLDIEPGSWAWTANVPGFGLLAEDFPAPALWHWQIGAEGASLLAPGGIARLPQCPFIGTLGIAPAQPGPHGIIPPRRVGGNMDHPELRAGSELWLPVEVPGALLSLGDGHVRQGDGEVCGTAVETSLRARLAVDVVKGAAPPTPRLSTRDVRTPELGREGYEITTGIGPDLMDDARAAVRAMIDLLSGRHGLDPLDAYLLCSVCADLRIGEIVDAPNWVVSLYFPRAALG